MPRFSKRHGHEVPDAEITVRDDAPTSLRSKALELAIQYGLRPHLLRSLLCDVLMQSPDPSNWSEYRNVHTECFKLIWDCHWFEVYDVIEVIAERLSARRDIEYKGDGEPGEEFTLDLNRYFRREGIGWQLVNDLIETRGSEAFEIGVRQGQEALAAVGNKTAAGELHKAIKDLSQRPEPEITGAVQHALAGLECAMRDACGNSNATFGQLLKHYPGLFKPPLDVALEKLWGYASNHGRHLKEGHPPTFEEAELAVGVSAAACRYLARKISADRN